MQSIMQCLDHGKSIIVCKYIHYWPKSEYCQIEGDISQLFSTLQEML